MAGRGRKRVAKVMEEPTIPQVDTHPEPLVIEQIYEPDQTELPAPSISVHGSSEPVSQSSNPATPVQASRISISTTPYYSPGRNTTNTSRFGPTVEQPIYEDDYESEEEEGSKVREPLQESETEGTNNSDNRREFIDQYDRVIESRAKTELSNNNDDKVREYSEDELHAIIGPIPLTNSMTDRCSEVEYRFPSCVSLHFLPQETPKEFIDTLFHRNRIAIEYAEQYLGKTINKPHIKLNRAEREPFERVYNLMDTLLSKTVICSLGTLVYFAARKEHLEELTQELFKLRDICEESFILKQETLPRLPRWGRDGNISNFWKPNDFEILGAAYRSEVEAYICQLHEIHFSSLMNKKIVNPPVIKAIRFEQPEIQPTRGQHKPSSSHPVFPINQANNAKTTQASSFGIPTPVGNPIAPTINTTTVPSNQVPVPNNPPPTRAPTNMNTTYLSNMQPVNRVNKPRFSNARHSSVFGLNAQTTTSKKLNEMFNSQSNQKSTKVATGGNGPPDGGDSDSDSDDSKGASKGPSSGRIPPLRRGGNDVSSNTINRAQFDTKLKLDAIPTWDGNIDLLGRWILKINRLSERSELIHEQLGILVPTRLTGSAEIWYYSMSAETRSRIEENWTTLRNTIGEYFMNRSYLEKMKVKANRAQYRETGHQKETPSEYFIRKLELLQLSYNYNDKEFINEIMLGTPTTWLAILTPHLFETLEDLQVAIRFHEDYLLQMDNRNRTWNDSNNNGNSRFNTNNRNPFTPYRNTRVNQVGWTKNTINPPFPKDDSNVSPRATPEDRGGRPCRHCGSLKHWDPECRYAKKGEKRARVNKVEWNEEDRQAQEEYEQLYYDTISDTEDDEKDF